MDGLTLAGMVACITLCSAICSVASFYFGRRKAAQDEAEEDGSLKTDLKYIKETVGDTTKSIDRLAMKLETQDKQREDEYREMLVQLTKIQSSYKSLHIRVDKIEEMVDRYHHNI